MTQRRRQSLIRAPYACLAIAAILTAVTATTANAVVPLTSDNVTYTGQTITSIDDLNFDIEAPSSFAVTTYNKPLTMKDTGVNGTVYSSGTPTIAHQDYIRDLDIDTAWSFGNDTTEPYNGAFEANLTTSITASIASELNEVALILFETGNGDSPTVQAYNGATALGTALEVTGSHWGNTGATSFAFSSGQDSVAVGLSLSDLGLTTGQTVTKFVFTATRNWDVTEIMANGNLVSAVDPPVTVPGVTVVDIGVDAHSVMGNSDWNTCLTLDASGNAYAAFVDSNLKNTVAKVTPGGVVTTQIIDTTDNADDKGHNTPSIAIDGDGILHVAYNMHNDNMRLLKSPAANSVSGTWVDEGGTGSPWGSGRFTYPAMSTAPNGDVYMSIRNRESGGPVQLFHYDNTAESWSSIAKFAGEDGYTAYLPAPYVDSDGKVHLSWHWQQGGPGAERQRGSYAVYDPSDDSFSKADGTEYIIPITTTTADLYQPSEADWGVKQIADTSLTVNDLGQPIIAYNFFREGDNDQRVLRLSRWDGSAWLRTDLEGPETGATLGDPVIVNRDGDLHIYYNDADGKLTLRSSSDDGLTFGDAITLTANAVRAAHVNIGTSIGDNQEAIFFLDPYDSYAAKVMFVDYAEVLTSRWLGDTNGDGFVNATDRANFELALGLAGAELIAKGFAFDPDFDNDGDADLDDFVMLRESFGNNYNLAPAVPDLSQAPEPTTMSLMALGALAILRRRRRK